MMESLGQQQESQALQKMHNWVVKQQHQLNLNGDLHKKRKLKTLFCKQVKKAHLRYCKNQFPKSNQ